MSSPIPREIFSQFVSLAYLIVPKLLLIILCCIVQPQESPELSILHSVLLYPKSEHAEAGDAETSAIATVGGSKGHVEETIGGELLKLYRYYPWKPIVNCTGRYTCRNHSASKLPPAEFLTRAGVQTMFAEQRLCLPDRLDDIVVLPMNKSKTQGLITYVKSEKSSCGQDENARYVHTLNTPSGFQRKLQAVGIDVEKLDFSISDQDDT